MRAMFVRMSTLCGYEQANEILKADAERMEQDMATLHDKFLQCLGQPAMSVSSPNLASGSCWPHSDSRAVRRGETATVELMQLMEGLNACTQALSEQMKTLLPVLAEVFAALGRMLQQQRGSWGRGGGMQERAAGSVQGRRIAVKKAAKKAARSESSSENESEAERVIPDRKGGALTGAVPSPELLRHLVAAPSAGVTAEAYQNFDLVLTQLLPVRVEIRATQAARKSYNNVAFLTGTLKLSEPASSSDPNPHMLLFLDFSRC